MTTIARAHATYVESLRCETDPFELLRRLDFEARGVSPARRVHMMMPHYTTFVRLACLYPDADRDALVNAARSVFRVRARTLRDDFARAAASRVNT